MQKISILGLSLVAVLVIAGCGSDHKNSPVKEGANVSIEKFGGVGSPLKQKVTIHEGATLELHMDVNNTGNMDAENVLLSCVMRHTPTDDYTLTFKQELTGVLKSSETHKQNIFIDGTAALEPGTYDLACEVSTSEDVNKKNNRRVIAVTIKGDSD